MNIHRMLFRFNYRFLDYLNVIGMSDRNDMRAGNQCERYHIHSHDINHPAGCFAPVGRC